MIMAPDFQVPKNIPIPSEDELKEADKALSIMVLVRGTLVDGQPFWAYLAVPPSKYLPFKQAEARGNYNLTDYGDVIEIGTGGEEPPLDVKQRMEREYHVNHRMEDIITKQTQ